MARKVNPVVGVLGTSGTVSQALHSVSTSLALAGNNTGNLVYQYAASLYLDCPSIFFSITEQERLERIKASIDILHIPAANQLNPAFNLSAWADLIEYLDKPIFVAGLGAQTELNEETFQLTGDNLRFIRAIQSRAPLIGVRGPKTEQLLKEHGVDNVIVTGCPSNFINPAVSGRTIERKLQRSYKLDKPRVDYFPGTMSHFRDVERHMRAIVAAHDCRYVLQTNEWLFRYLAGDSTSPDVLEYLSWERRALSDFSAQADYNANLMQRGKFYFSAPAWMDSIAQRDIGIGMRMHGVVATIQGGGAGICIVSDGRIEELVTTMGYPAITPEQTLQAANIRQLIEATHFDAAEFDTKRHELASAYERVARESGVRIRPPR